MSYRPWNYYNGRSSWLNRPAEPMTLAYCGECGPKHIPSFNHVIEPDGEQGRGHWDTGFRCAPWTLGCLCNGCGKSI
jgi:hypothetical protein